jgi:hypothetical protein
MAILTSSALWPHRLVAQYASTKLENRVCAPYCRSKKLSCSRLHCVSLCCTWLSKRRWLCRIHSFVWMVRTLCLKLWALLLTVYHLYSYHYASAHLQTRDCRYLSTLPPPPRAPQIAVREIETFGCGMGKQGVRWKLTVKRVLKLTGLGHG